MEEKTTGISTTTSPDASTTAPQDAPSTKSILRRVDWHLLPALFWLHIVVSLNGTSIAIARVQGMQDDLDMHKSDYNVAVFVYFIPLVLFDVPANLLIRKVSPSAFLCSCAFVSGVILALQGISQPRAGIVVCRLLLGICASGFYAGSVYLLASYYPKWALHTRLSPLLACRLLASGFGGLLGYAFTHLDGVAGYSAWRWTFIIEGIATGVSAAVAIFLLPGWPENSGFLDLKEQSALIQALPNLAGLWIRRRSTWQTFVDVLRDPKITTSTLIHFGCTVNANVSAFFLPVILDELGWTSIKAQYMAVPVYLTAAAVSVCIGIASDRAGRRYIFCTTPLLAATAGHAMLLAGEHVSVQGRYAACFLSTAGTFAALAISITWLSNNIHEAKERGIAFGVVAGIGNLGHFLGSNVFLEREAPLFLTGFTVCLVMSLLSALAATLQVLYLQWTVRSCKNSRVDVVL